MKARSRNEVYIPSYNYQESNSHSNKSPNQYTSNQKKTSNPYPRTIRLSIPEIQEKQAMMEAAKNSGSITYKEPRKEQSPENSNLHSGKILSNKVKVMNVNLDNERAERKRSRSPFLDEKAFVESVKNSSAARQTIDPPQFNNMDGKPQNFESNRDDRIAIKEILRNNFFKEANHSKSNSVHQINYEIRNLLNRIPSNNPSSNHTPNNYSLSIKPQQANINLKNTLNDRSNLFQDKSLRNYKENNNETPFASLAKEKNFNLERSIADKKLLVNEVPVSSFINHMNLKNFKNSSNSPHFNVNMDSRGINKQAFDFKYVIGKGGFGKVWKVEQKKNRTLYAMKEMSKSKVISKRSVNSVMNERELLSMIEHPFIVNMVYAFQDRENLYLVMDLMTGGDLRYHIGRQRRFNEFQTKFFVACILLGLEYLHDKGIIHRDIKPENLVLDKNGYVRITDMGIARLSKPENSSDTSGTPGYMAPEVMCRQNHTIAVDYFAVGVIAYEFMLGRRPYLGRSRKEIRDAILAKQEQIKRNDIPDGWSLEGADFVNKMLQRKPSNRLGSNGPREVKQHPWFKNFPWDKLTKKELMTPFRPNPRGDNFDQKQQISLDGETNEDIIQQNALLLKRNSVQKLFLGYDYEGTPLPLRKDEENTRSRSSSIAGAKTTVNSTSSGSLILNS